MRPRVVVCGSFHRDTDGLRRLFRELEATGCRILSPISLDFSNPADFVVRTKTEFDMSTAELEKYHLRAMRDADFIWLHAPSGHVGTSASFEVGYATALNKPVYCHDMPSDEMLQTQVTQLTSVFAATELI